MKTTLKTILFGLFLAGCGGPTGDHTIHTDDAKKLSTLTDAERIDVCTAVLNRFGGPGSQHSCDNGKTKITIQEVSDCASAMAHVKPDCKATVADVDACTDDQGKDLCVAIDSAPCKTVEACTPAQ